MLTLKTKIKEINRVGQTTAGRLKRLGIVTVEDLLWHLPWRYDDLSQVKDISALEIDELTTVRGRIELLNSRRARRRRLTITEALVTDITGSLKVIWFNQPYINKTLKIGDEVLLAGKVSGDLLGRQMNNPSYEKVSQENIHTARLVPIYPATEKLTQKQLRFLIKSCLPALIKLKDWLPEEIKQENKLIDLNEAIEQIHFPDDAAVLKIAQERLQFDEMFLIQIYQQWARKSLEETLAPALEFKQVAIKNFVAQLPFTLTDDQRKAAWEILRNLGNNHPMNRLLDGDVGSGKTVVAALAAYNVALNDSQVALMAPTAILARQHLQTIAELLPADGPIIGLLTLKQCLIYEQGKLLEIKKTELLKKIKSGAVALIIGTHALIQKNVAFKNLALVIVDEQHRFGVAQRQALQAKSGDPETMPHFLSMTATPIPRTLALALYNDLDISLLKQLPAGRQKIITRLVPPTKRPQAYEFVNKEIAAGHGVFVICPLIDPSDKLGVKSVSEEYEHLDKEVFPHLRIGQLHGKLKPEEKNQILTDFKENKIKILVSTSVVEVGVDIPQATVMIIEDADRFGLAQLHQFRGRVGRGKNQSYCFLFTDSHSPQTWQRLKTLVDNFDGFSLAEKDLKLRGSGNLFGTAQTGFINQLTLKALSNLELLKKAKNSAQNILQADPSLTHYPLLKQKMAKLEMVSHLE